MPNETYLSTWKKYQSAWSDMSLSERQNLLRSSVAEKCIYTDPQSVCHGLAELVARIERTQQQYPGASFVNDEFVDHHAQGLSNWTMRDARGATIATGTSYARFGEDGRLTKMTGFFKIVSDAAKSGAP